MNVQSLIKLIEILDSPGEQSSSGKNTSFEVGKTYLIKTVTMFYTGRLMDINDYNIVLEDAAWIADTGRFSDALKTGEFSEIEPYPDGVKPCITLNSIVDFNEWSHPLPREQK